MWYAAIRPVMEVGEGAISLSRRVTAGAYRWSRDEGTVAGLAEITLARSLPGRYRYPEISIWT
jgi:hypothetical protein